MPSSFLERQIETSHSNSLVWAKYIYKHDNIVHKLVNITRNLRNIDRLLGSN
jgi:hypothetical protein